MAGDMTPTELSMRIALHTLRVLKEQWGEERGTLIFLGYANEDIDKLGGLGDG